MAKYVLRRLLTLIPVLFGVSIFVFGMMHVVPGDPVAVMMAGSGASWDDMQELRQQLRLDQPLHVQYIDFLTCALRGDLGSSMFTRRPVVAEIRDQLAATLQLAVTALMIATAFGIVLGTSAAIFENTWLDTTAVAFSLVGVSIPNFYLGLVLMFIFSFTLGWLPAMGAGGLKRLILPALTLGAQFSAVTTRMVRASLIEVLRQDYIRTARAKGLSEQIIVLRHALKNAFIPVITIIGLQFGSLLGGAVVVEVVFARQGIGRLSVEAILAKDFPVVQATVLLSAIGYTLANLFVDISYSLFDPRIRSGT